MEMRSVVVFAVLVGCGSLGGYADVKPEVPDIDPDTPEVSVEDDRDVEDSDALWDTGDGAVDDEAPSSPADTDSDMDSDVFGDSDLWGDTGAFAPGGTGLFGPGDTGFP